MCEKCIKRKAWKLLGRDIGTATGLDGDPWKIFVLWDFIPNANIALPNGDLHIDLINGQFQYYDEGKITNDFDILTILKS